jgi:hypothetical protein
MSYRKYKLILILFLLLYLSIWLVFRFIYSDTPSIKLSIILFVIATVVHISLFSFILYAKSKKIDNCNKRISPTRLFPAITLFVVFVALGYSLSMLAIYIALKPTVVKNDKQLEVSLVKVQNMSTDENIPSDKRLKLASFYYRYTGDRIYYLNENNERQIYYPDEITKHKRKSYVEAIDSVKNLFLFLTITSIIALSLSIIVGIIYFRIRKKDLLKQKEMGASIQ